MTDQTSPATSRYPMFISWQEQMLTALEEDHAQARTDDHRKALEHAIEITKMSRDSLQQALETISDNQIEACAQRAVIEAGDQHAFQAYRKK